MEKVTLYHSTLSENIPSILKMGIVTRTPEQCRKRIDDMLRKYGIDKEKVKVHYEYAISRCMESKMGVCVSGDKAYSIQNCRAGMEDLELILRGIATYKADDKKYGELVKELIPKPSCHTCEIEVPLDTPLELGAGTVRDEIERAKSRLREAFPEWSEERVTEESNRIKRCLIFKRIPPEWITSCKPTLAEGESDFKYIREKAIKSMASVKEE